MKHQGKINKEACSGSMMERRAKEAYSYSYADGPDQVANLQAPDMANGRSAGIAMDNLAKRKLKDKLAKGLELGSPMKKGSDKPNLGGLV